MDIKNKIMPIGNYNYYEGCGFFVEDYFITCAHVIENADRPFLNINGAKFALEHPVFYQYSRNTSEYDLAIFHIPGIDSNFTLNDGVIDEGAKVTSISYKELGELKVECNVTIGVDKEGNYISGISDQPLKGGCSGSPILRGTEVVGMITGGNNDGNNTPCNPDLPLNLCVFLSSLAIKRALENIQLK